MCDALIGSMERFFTDQSKIKVLNFNEAVKSVDMARRHIESIGEETRNTFLSTAPESRSKKDVIKFKRDILRIYYMMEIPPLLPALDMWSLSPNSLLRIPACGHMAVKNLKYSNHDEAYKDVAYLVSIGITLSSEVKQIEAEAKTEIRNSELIQTALDKWNASCEVFQPNVSIAIPADGKFHTIYT